MPAAPRPPQNAELYRRRALDAIEKINCLQEFAHARDPSSLPPLFHDDARLGEAAVRAGGQGEAMGCRTARRPGSGC